MMSRQTGRHLTPLAHLRQSVNDILTTRIGTRVQREAYGSLLPDFIDQPKTPALKLQMIAATIMALSKWEPRLSVRAVRFTADSQLKTRMVIEGIVNGHAVSLGGFSLVRY